ncbi:MAG: hypothetical protein ACM3ZF_11360 [Mycobacterium leprae]
MGNSEHASSEELGKQDTDEQNPPALTVGEFLDVVKHLNPDVPITIAVRDRHHFNTLLRDRPVVDISVTQGSIGPVVTLDVVDMT